MSKFFAKAYDHIMEIEKKTKLRQIRKDLITSAHGRVLEIGSGSGVNFPFYNKVQVNAVDAIEPNHAMIKASQTRIEMAQVPIQTHTKNAEQITFPENTFDSVVSTLVYCTIPNPLETLCTIRHVAKSDSPLLFLEHVKTKRPISSTIQSLANPIWKRIAGGCNLNRDTEATIRESGIYIEEVLTYYKGWFVVIKCRNP